MNLNEYIFDLDFWRTSIFLFTYTTLFISIARLKLAKIIVDILKMCKNQVRLFKWVYMTSDNEHETEIEISII